MAKEFEAAIKSDLKLELAHEFARFYAGKIEEVPFFELLEERLNQAGYYTYNSDTRFEVYAAESVDLTDDEIRTSLELDEAKQGQVWINLNGVSPYQIEQIKLNLLEHIQEEIRCEVYPKEMTFKIFTQ